MNKYTILGITIFLILALASTQPIREDQSCLTKYASWYYSGQQCMQCYNYFQSSVETCHKCAQDKCTGCDSEHKLVSGKYNTIDNAGKVIEVELSYCRSCGSGNNVEECCFMDQKEKIQFNNDEIKENDSNFESYTYGVGSHMTTGYHATKCKTQENGQDIKLYGSICYTIANCKKIGDYGHCMQCLDGFYLNNDLSCTACDNHDWYGDSSSELKNPKVSRVGSNSGTNDFCKKCNGPSQCSECGMNSAMTKGSFLLTNQGREFYDLNIAKNPSFCRECNNNCLCTDSTELCKTCIDGTSTTPETVGAYYYNPHKQQCYPCNTIKNNTGDTLCNQCMWVTELDRPVCVGCQARTNSDGETAFKGYNQKLREFIDDNSYNVLAFPLTYYKRTNEDHKIEEVSNKEVQCIPCYELFKTSREQTVTWENLSNPVDPLAYKIKELDNENYEIDGQKESKIIYFDHSATNTESYQGQSSSAFNNGGCAKCSLISVTGQYKENQSTDEYTTSDRKKDTVHYVTCDQCHNGFAEVVYTNFSFTGRTSKPSSPEVTGYPMRFSIQNYKKCHSCQYLMKLHDKKLIQYKDGSEDKIALKDDMRYKATSRCQRLQHSSQLKSFFNYSLTQCSSESVDDYMGGNLTKDKSKDQSYNNRGTGYLSNTHNIEDKTITSRASITNYFVDAINQLGKFRVNVSQSGSSKYKRMQNLCVTNKNKCKSITEISQDTETPARTENAQNTFSPLTSPRCQTCFENYILTQDRTCVHCPSGYSVVGDNANDNASITYGCNACIAEQLTDNKYSKKVLCNGCHNSEQSYSQIKKSMRENKTYQLGIDRKNYFFIQSNDKRECKECQLGCLTCLNENERCKVPQNYWRIVDNGDKDNTTFERCAVDYCVNCDSGKNICDRCEAGFAVIKLHNTEEEAFRYECERCEKGCLRCESDVYTDSASSGFQQSIYNRKKCLACAHGYYLDLEGEKGTCKPVRSNCINWLQEGGECLQCEYGYRLQDGWCYACTYTRGADSGNLQLSGLLSNGYWDCPSQCDSETGITSSSSNVRNAEALKKNAELTNSKNPQPEPEEPETPAEPAARILQLLDEFQPSN